MRLSLLKKGHIYNTNLPLNINGSYWISDKDKNNQKRNLINVFAKDNKWVIKSNFEAMLVIDGNIQDETILEEYKLYEIKVVGEEQSYLLYTSPVFDSQQKKLEIRGQEITIGRSENNSICYYNDLLSENQCILTINNGKWHIKNNDDKPILYINRELTKEKDLNIGDIIFIVGIKIIFCNSFIILSYPQGKVMYNTNILPEMLVNNDKKVETQSENTEIKMYDKNDYFFRMPRFKSSIEEMEIPIDAPPEPEKEEEMPLAYTIGPMITMGITSMVTGVTSLNNVMEGTQTLKSALPSLVTCFAMILSMFLWPTLQKSYADKQAKKREDNRIKKYNEYIAERKNYIKTLVTQQRNVMIDNNLPLTECKEIIYNRKRNLWERKIEHDDFLELRVGIGNVKPLIKVSYPETHFTLSENNLRGVLDSLGEETKVMENVPVTINLTKKFATAVIGRKDLTQAFMEGLLLRTMTFHSYESLKIIIMTSEENKGKWEYFKTLPFCQNDDNTIRFFSTTVDDANQISNYLENIYQNRKFIDGDTNKLNNTDYKNYSPYYLIITDDYQSVRNIEIVKNVLEQKINYGFSMLIVQERLLGLPNECSAFLDIEEANSGIIENELAKDKQQIFAADFIGELNIREISKVLANIPIEMDKDRYALPSRLGFLEMYNVGKIEQLNIANRWKNNNPISTLQAPVGVDNNGELLKLDIHEKFHGPHGLVAGMTGSGKSEFIITYILSMAINYDPDEVSFVLIDYKGGGLAGAFENKETGIRIPHLAGTITNLDVNDMKRALASIESELKRRQRIFAEARQKLNESTIDIYKYQKFRREGKVTEAVPHLIIVSDEFAELKTQQPEFMEQLISTARIGRSLGVHLILATQKPSGVVDDQIWSNTKFRVCLKVQDKSDSVDMIKCPDAASLHNVGRFYLQVGYNELFTMGQSAYAGVQYENTDKIKKKVDTNIDFIDNVGYVVKSIDVEERLQKKTYGEELTNIVKYLYDLGEKENKHSSKLWLDKIPANIYVDDLEKKYNYQAEKCVINPVIGEYDVPSMQEQHLLTLPLTKEGNTIIYGAAGSGKESLLNTILYSTMVHHVPDEVAFYIIDFGAETLKMYDDSPHVGGVLLANDKDEINNLFKMLKKEINKRKKLFQEFGGNYLGYCKYGKEVIPNIVFIINFYESFKEMYPELEDAYQQITREGFKYGIISIITTNGVNFVGYKLKQNFKQNFVLQLNDESDYSDIVGNTRGMYPSKIEGRGLIKIKNIYEFQSAKFVKNNLSVSEYVKSVCEYYRKVYPNKAKRIPVLPKIVNFDTVKNNINGLVQIPIGVEKNSLEIATIDCRSKPITLISSVESNAFETFIPEFMKVCRSNKELAITMIDAEKMFEKNEFKCVYYKDKFDSIFDELNIYLNKLYDIYVKNNYDDSALKDCQDLLIIINGISQFMNKTSSETQNKFDEFVKRIKELRKVSLIIVDTITNIKQYEYESWYKANVSNNYGIWIGDGINDQYTIKLSKTPKYIKEDIGNRFGYKIDKGNPIMIKVLTTLTEEDGDEDDE